MSILDEKLYTPAEAAPKLRVGRATVWAWIRDGKMKATAGRRKLIPESELLRALTCEQLDANRRQKRAV